MADKSPKRDVASKRERRQQDEALFRSGVPGEDIARRNVMWSPEQARKARIVLV